jgi:ketosteroid isomerase-like protein
MKKIIFSLFAVLLIAGCTPPKEEIDIAKEEEAIKQVVQATLDAIKAESYDAIAATWVHAPYVVRKDMVGWDSVSVFFQESLKEWFDGPENNQISVFTASNFDIYINGNFASVFHDERLERIWDGEEMTSDSRVHKYFEKIEGEWKVITLF